MNPKSLQGSSGMPQPIGAELCPEDRSENDLALKEGNRILSAYTTRAGIRFWIITESDRSATTVLLPEDYWSWSTSSIAHS